MACASGRTGFTCSACVGENWRFIVMKRLSRAVTVLVMTLMLVTSFVPMVDAATHSQTVWIKPNQVWSQGYGCSRDMRYSFVGARCIAVYPFNGTDLFRIIQCGVFDTLSENILKREFYRLTEGEAQFASMEIAQGHLDNSVVYFKFRGNTNEQAEAKVMYTGSLAN